MYERTPDWSRRVEMLVRTSWINWWNCWRQTALTLIPARSYAPPFSRHGSARSLGGSTWASHCPQRRDADHHRWWQRLQVLRPSSRLNACVRVNGGHFEHKFWASDFLLCFVCFIDTGFRKCDRDKHVQSANIGVKCVIFVSETFTRYGSNITNVW